MASHKHQAWKSMLGASCNSRHSTEGIFDNWTLAGTVFVHVTSAKARHLIPNCRVMNYGMVDQPHPFWHQSPKLSVAGRGREIKREGTLRRERHHRVISRLRSQEKLCHLWEIRITPETYIISSSKYESCKVQCGCGSHWHQRTVNMFGVYMSDTQIRCRHLWKRNHKTWERLCRPDTVHVMPSLNLASRAPTVWCRTRFCNWAFLPGFPPILMFDYPE